MTRGVDLSKVGAGRQKIEQKSKDRHDSEEESFLDSKQRMAGIQALEEANLNSAAYRQMRETYANRVFHYLVGYSLFCGAIVVLQGLADGTWFSLPSEVLIAIVGSTAVSAIGLVLAVVNGLFQKH